MTGDNGKKDRVAAVKQYVCYRDESVDLIAFLFNIEANKKFYHRHIVDIPRIKFLV